MKKNNTIGACNRILLRVFFDHFGKFNRTRKFDFNNTSAHLEFLWVSQGLKNSLLLIHPAYNNHKSFLFTFVVPSSPLLVHLKAPFPCKYLLSYKHLRKAEKIHQSDEIYFMALWSLKVKLSRRHRDQCKASLRYILRECCESTIMAASERCLQGSYEGIKLSP